MAMAGDLPYARTAAAASLARTGGGALAEPERRARFGERQLPDRVRPCLAEAEVGVDGEHVLVDVRVAGADELRVRALAQDALEHDRLHPEAELVAAVRLDDAGTALPDDMTDARVVLHLGEAGALAGRLMDRDDEPPLGPRLFQPRLAIAQLCLGEALICEAQIALGHVVHRIRRVEVRLHELARNDVHLGPARVRVLGLVLVPADEAGADERSRHIARGEGRAPLRWRRRAQARLDRVDRSEWVLRDALVVHRLEHSRRLGELGVG